MSKTLVQVFGIFGICAAASTATAAEVNQWDGEWLAEGTLFQIGVSVENNTMVVTQIESMGQIWSNQDGAIEGNTVTVEVEYAGAKGTIQAELIDESTAVAFAASCLPDFMVVCVLSKDRQAIFKKVSD